MTAPANPPPTLPNLPKAACQGHPQPLWDDTVHDETPDQRVTRHTHAIAICARCPERFACHAARMDDPTLGPGVWGGRVFGPDRTRRCDVCDQPYQPAHTLQRYCSDPCRAAAQRTRPADYTPPEACLHCGASLAGLGGHGRRYCTPRCREASKYRRLRTRGPRCRHCAGPLPGGATRYCSEACRLDADAARRRSRAQRPTLVPVADPAPRTHCRWCGVELAEERRRRHAVYCGERCMSRSKRRQRSERPVPTHCRWCGKELPERARRYRAKLCSATCRRATDAARHRQRKASQGAVMTG